MNAHPHFVRRVKEPSQRGSMCRDKLTHLGQGGTDVIAQIASVVNAQHTKQDFERRVQKHCLGRRRQRASPAVDLEAYTDTTRHANCEELLANEQEAGYQEPKVSVPAVKKS